MGVLLRIIVRNSVKVKSMCEYICYPVPGKKKHLAECKPTADT